MKLKITINKNIYKIFKIITLLLLIVAIIFICLDLRYNMPYQNSGNIVQYFISYKNKSREVLLANYVYKKDGRLKKSFKNIENKNSNLEPILLFGDTHVYGNFLEENETFANILGRITKRPIYNQSSPYVIPQQILFELQSEEFYKVVKKPEFIFYLYVPPHIMEVYTKCSRSSHDIFYKISGNKLVRYEKVPFYKKSFLLAHVNALLFNNKKINSIYFKIGEDIYKRLLIESKKEAQKHWDDEKIKFVIIRYFNSSNELEDKIFEDLKKEGFIIFEMNKYIDAQNKKYTISNILPKIRANGYFWETIIPIMVKELNIK